MADGAPLLPVVAEPTSAAGHPVRGSRVERFLSWFPRFRREKPLPPPQPSVTAPAPSAVSPASLAAAAAGFAEAAARGSALGEEARSFAEAARAFADAYAEEGGEEEPRDPRFAEDLKARASALAVAADLLLQQLWMSESTTTTTTGLAVKALDLCMDSQALLPAFDLLPASSAGRETETDLQSLLRRAGKFCTESSGTTMEESAKDFYEAAEAFAAGDLNYDKVAAIPLTQAAMKLSRIASMAPPNEKELVLIAQELESDASVLVLDDDNSILVQRNVLKLKRRTSPAKQDEKADALLRRAQVFAGQCRGHVVLTGPTADLIEVLRKFADAPSAATAATLGVAAEALAKLAGSNKLEEGQALAAQQIAIEAADLAAGRPGAQPPSESRTCSKSPEVLFYIAIPSSLGLLPYLSTTITKGMQGVVGCLFGVVFSASTLGAVLIARGRDNTTDMQVASILGAICFTAFSFLVIVFVSCALVGGSLVLIGVLAVILAALHTYFWARK